MNLVVVRSRNNCKNQNMLGDLVVVDSVGYLVLRGRKIRVTTGIIIDKTGC